MITTREDLGNSGASVERRVPLHLGDLIPEVNNVTPLCRPSLQTSKMLKVRCFVHPISGCSNTHLLPLKVCYRNMHLICEIGHQISQVGSYLQQKILLYRSVFGGINDRSHENWCSNVTAKGSRGRLILSRCRRVGPKQDFHHRQLEKFLQSIGSHGSHPTSSRTEWFPPALTPCTTATDRRLFSRDHRVGIRLQQMMNNTSPASPKVCPNFMQLGFNFSHDLHIAVTTQNPSRWVMRSQ